MIMLQLCMQAASFIYLFVIALTAVGIMSLERQKWRFFNYIPGIVLTYGLSMLIAQSGIWNHNNAITHTYTLLKSNLLPAMLFLMLLSIDFKSFFALGRKPLIAYAAAVISLMASFSLVFWIFGFNYVEAGTFAALGASWMGGTANMLAVGAALHVSDNAMGYALIVDSLNYTLWVMLLLSLVGSAAAFNRFSGADSMHQRLQGIGCSCTIGPKRYWLLLGIALAVSILAQLLGAHLNALSQTTWVVLLATLFGLIGSRTPLQRLNGSSELSNTMLYLLVALIGSHAYFEKVDAIWSYIAAGSTILLFHAIMMLIAARLFKLDLFSIAVASLANIGGVASAPILAAAYNRALIGVAVLMAIMGYLIGTFSGLALGHFLQWIAS
jgi:uncharacterized membrane protein